MNDLLSCIDTRHATQREGQTTDGPTLHGKRPWGFGNYVPGPCLPHGSIHPSPDTARARSGGYDPSFPVRGFSQLHVSGTGGPGKYGTILIAPMVGDLLLGEDAHDSPVHDETAAPHAYAATLSRWGIRVELTVTHHAAIYRLRFPAGAPTAHVLVDLAHSIPENAMHRGGGPVAAEAIWSDDGRVLSGRVRHRGGWGTDSYGACFHAEFDQPGDIGLAIDGTFLKRARSLSHDVAGRRLIAVWSSSGPAPRELRIKIAVSLHSPARAAALLAREIPDFDHDHVQAAAADAWRAALGAVDLDGADPERRRLFATALRNSLIMPRDRSQDCPHWSSSEPWWDEHYCVWDTCRTVFPLLSLIRPQAVAANVRSFADRLRHGERVSDAYINGRELTAQPGPPGAPAWFGGMGGEMTDVVICEALLKGLPGIDAEAAFAVLHAHADSGRCLPYRDGDRGFIPDDDCRHSDGTAIRHPAAFSLEMSYTDDCAARIAARLGRADLATRWRRRAQQWRALWNPQLCLDGFTGFFSARRRDGSFDDHRAVGVRGGAFTESTTWDYDHFVPHDLAGLIALHGGGDAYAARVDFALRNDRLLLDNEPAFLLLHTLIYAGRPDLCQAWTRAHLLGNYSRDAVPGPDDSGAMAAWYVFGALGLFPVAGQDLYLLHGPLQQSATLRLPGGTLRIEAPAFAADRPYIARVQWNGRLLERAYLRHAELAAGGELIFETSATPTAWGAQQLPPGPWQDDDATGSRTTI